MVEVLFKYYGKGEFEVFSVGIEFYVVDFCMFVVIEYFGLKIDDLYLKYLNDVSNLYFDYVIILCDDVVKECVNCVDGSYCFVWDFIDFKMCFEFYVFEKIL